MKVQKNNHTHLLLVFMHKLFLGVALLLSVDSTLFASSKGAELFESKCVICHPMTRPADKSQMLAPPIKGVIFHLGEDIGSDDKILSHINSFVMYPTKEKAICRSVRRFGLMPSQKDNITKEELDIVAKWMIENLKMSEKDYANRKNRK